MTRTIGDGDPRDFDETRRLCYMALLAPATEKYNLAGTLVNALAHHHAIRELTPRQIAAHVVNVIEQREDHGESEAWLNSQIDRITGELGS